MKENRKNKRVKRYFAINIIAVDTDGKHMRFDKLRVNPKFYDESGLDFAPGGVKIMCSKSLPIESKIQMKMMLPDTHGLNLIRANGTIKWFKQIKGKYKKYFVLGVNFRDLPKDDKNKLIRLWKDYQ